MAGIRLTRPEPTEATVQAAVLHALALHPDVAWAHRMNSGAAWLPGKGGKLRPVRFGFVGCPDVIGQLVDGRFLAIEVKRPSGATTTAQEAFLARVRANGGVAGVVRSVDDLVALLAGQDGPGDRAAACQIAPGTRRAHRVGVG